jgi:hypothetical protein
MTPCPTATPLNGHFCTSATKNRFKSCMSAGNGPLIPNAIAVVKSLMTVSSTIFLPIPWTWFKTTRPSTWCCESTLMLRRRLISLEARSPSKIVHGSSFQTFLQGPPPPVPGSQACGCSYENPQQRQGEDHGCTRRKLLKFAGVQYPSLCLRHCTTKRHWPVLPTPANPFLVPRWV